MCTLLNYNFYGIINKKHTQYFSYVLIFPTNMDLSLQTKVIKNLPHTHVLPYFLKSIQSYQILYINFSKCEHFMWFLGCKIEKCKFCLKLLEMYWHQTFC